MARTQDQVNQFLNAFRNTGEFHRRAMDSFGQLKNLYDDLGMSGLTDAEVQVQNPGLTAADINAALSTAGQLLTEYTPTRRATINRIGHGAP